MASLLSTGISSLLPQSSLGRTNTLKPLFPKSSTLKITSFNTRAHITGESTTLPSHQPSKSSPFPFLNLSVHLNEKNLVDEVDSEDDRLEYSFDSEEEDSFDSFVTSAVPKKRTSHTKTKIRKNHWKRKAKVAAKKAFSLGKSIATGRSKSFFVPQTTEK